MRKDNDEPFRVEMVALKSDDVFERLHLDLCGPLTESYGQTHIAVLQDSFSKWLEASALPYTRASTIIRWLAEFFLRFRTPRSITTNGGTQDFREFKFRILPTTGSRAPHRFSIPSPRQWLCRTSNPLGRNDAEDDVRGPKGVEPTVVAVRDGIQQKETPDDRSDTVFANVWPGKQNWTGCLSCI